MLNCMESSVNSLLINETAAHCDRFKWMAFVHSTGEWQRANQANTSPFIDRSHTERQWLADYCKTHLIILMCICNLTVFFKKKDRNINNFRSNFFVIKPTRRTNFTNLFCHVTLHVSDSSSVHHQEFIHCTLSNGICHTGL